MRCVTNRPARFGIEDVAKPFALMQDETATVTTGRNRALTERHRRHGALIVFTAFHANAPGFAVQTRPGTGQITTEIDQKTAGTIGRSIREQALNYFIHGVFLADAAKIQLHTWL